MKKIIIAAGLVIAGLIAISYISAGKGPSQKAAHPTASVGEGRNLRHVAAEGKVEALPGFEVEVGSEIEGRIAEFFVEEGDIISKGGLIARMEDRDILAKLKESEAEYAASRAKYREVASGAREEELRRTDAIYDKACAEADTAENEADRHKKLFERGIVSRSSLDEAERAYKVAAARVRETEEERKLLSQGPKQDTLQNLNDLSDRAEASVLYYKTVLDKTRIAAPISGKVIRKYLQRGELVSKDVTPLLVAIADTRKLRINAEVDETDIGRFSLGDPVEVTSYAFPGKIFKGTVSEIADYAGLRKVLPNNPVKNRDMKIVQVKIALSEEAPFKLGMTVDVKILPKKHPGG